MAKIEKVEYEKIPGEANFIKEKGENINSSLKGVYSKIGEMHTSWHGQRYKTLVEDFNRIRPNIKNLLSLVVVEIPFALNTVANNYSLADQGKKISAAEKGEYQDIPELTVFNETDLRFMSAEVENVKKDVVTQFSQCEQLMNEIENRFKSSTQQLWISDASKEFANKFSTLKKDITVAFQNLNKDFDSLMKQTLDDIDAAEKSNTVS